MEIRDSVLAAIGNTPLIKLRRASEETGCTILGKAEFMNPGASVKDRAALGIVRDAIESGELRPGGLIVDGTAGNTGIGLAIVGNALGMRTVIVIPETQAQEKKDALRSLGASLVEVPAVPYRNPNNYVKVGGRLAERLAREHPQGAIWANQFDNVANRDIHVATTGPEIWQQTQGKVDGFVSAIGTGGTLAGVAMALRERKPDIIIALADVPGAAMHSYYTSGELKAEGSSISEGIGQGRVTANLEGFQPDRSYLIPDAESLAVSQALLREEGLALGLSSGVNVAGAIRLARELGPGKTIVTMLCDPATRYQSRLFNPEFLRSKGLRPPEWLERPVEVEADFVPVPASV
ncbi:MAG TPA: cysteine synthase A [Sphingomicrobium sp.]|nr:cysteine synthase A [Sphingomicrobium sp.]